VTRFRRNTLSGKLTLEAKPKKRNMQPFGRSQRRKSGSKKALSLTLNVVGRRILYCPDAFHSFLQRKDVKQRRLDFLELKKNSR